ncbi:Putative L-lactate dehydrogenase operon regulatory protein [Roseivivax jejudonensis]|uniref:Putative L-lactate dehydrogenase operon regulatory protein n=1 Tax=Roseivivax jejudonensis TaxID=1529041 RepID=A0A1X6Y5H6_9RHOB|nr:FCD domain-containing protein [Roseivivax jejudonensis]SLN09768.1 Putative L-lactate dehydrogenase operon regulatory protein [Roseivivax jejudonensis]
MLVRADQPERDDAADLLRAMIAERELGPGDRLPAERHLIDLLGIGRSALRKALDQLERDGLIWRHVGKGTFVSHAAGDETGIDPFAGIGAHLTPYRMMRARITIEPAMAREAAMNASRDALARIRTTLARQRAAASWTEYERQDDQFHRDIAAAADNALLLALFDSLNRVRREVAWGSVTRTTTRPPEDHSSFGEHEAIAAAIEAREQDAAHDAMRRHLKSVAARLFGDP